MAKKILKGLIFGFILMLVWGLSTSLFAQEAEDYEFTAKDKLILTQPSICYVTTIYYGYIYDPNFEEWSVQYMYGPMGG